MPYRLSLRWPDTKQHLLCTLTIILNQWVLILWLTISWKKSLNLLVPNLLNQWLHFTDAPNMRPLCALVPNSQKNNKVTHRLCGTACLAGNNVAFYIWTRSSLLLFQKILLGQSTFDEISAPGSPAFLTRPSATFYRASTSHCNAHRICTGDEIKWKLAAGRGFLPASQMLHMETGNKNSPKDKEI